MVDDQREHDTVVTGPESVHYRKFAPIDRESPIIEILYKESIIMDVARRMGNDTTSEFEVAFHQAAGGLRIPTSALMRVIATATDMVVSDEASG